MFNTTRALVLRETRYKEADRILTLFTESDGKISARVRGALRKGSKTAAATQQLTLAELTLFGNRGKWTVDEATVIEPFAGLRSDIGRLALGCYFAECLDALSVEGQPEPDMLQLGLNSLYAVSRNMFEQALVKLAFELRLMCIAGYKPALGACIMCGKERPEEPLFRLSDGAICCRSCRREGDGAVLRLTDSALEAAKFIVAAPAKRLFSFETDDIGLANLSQAAERYLLEHTERGFSTLDYWKKVR